MRLTIALLGIAVLASTVLADLTTDAAYVDPSNVAWRGTVSFNNSSHIIATVDYCVFAPGSFPHAGFTLDLGASYAPASNEFVYAYQMHNLGNFSLSLLSVKMLDGNRANNIGYLPGVGVAPSASEFDGDAPNRLAANWYYEGSGLTAGQSTDYLVYTSVQGPLWNLGTIQDDGQSITNNLPSPASSIPEPMTLTTFALGLLGLGRKVVTALSIA